MVGISTQTVEVIFFFILHAGDKESLTDADSSIDIFVSAGVKKEVDSIFLFLCLAVWLCLKMGSQNMMLMRLLQIGAKELTVPSKLQHQVFGELKFKLEPKVALFWHLKKMLSPICPYLVVRPPRSLIRSVLAILSRKSFQNTDSMSNTIDMSVLVREKKA